MKVVGWAGDSNFGCKATLSAPVRDQIGRMSRALFQSDTYRLLRVFGTLSVGKVQVFGSGFISALSMKAFRILVLFLPASLLSLDLAEPYLSLVPSGGTLELPQNVSSVFGNSSSITSNSSLVGAPRYRCNGREYGSDLELDSCVEAAQDIADTLLQPMDQNVRFGDTHGVRWPVALPYRSIACKLLLRSIPKPPVLMMLLIFRLATGSCAIDIVLKEGASSDVASGAYLQRWALVLIEVCGVDRETTQGGLVSNLGEFLPA